MGQMLICCWLHRASPSPKPGTWPAVFFSPAAFPGVQLPHMHKSYFQVVVLWTEPGSFHTSPTSPHTRLSWSPPPHPCTRSHVTLARSPPSPLLCPPVPSAVHHVFTNSSLRCFIFLSCLYIFGSSRGSICSTGFRAMCMLPGCQHAHAVHAADRCLSQRRRAELPFPLLLQGTPSVLSALPIHQHFMILVGVKYLWDFYFSGRFGKNRLTASGFFAGWGSRREDRQPLQLHSSNFLENQAKN